MSRMNIKNTIVLISFLSLTINCSRKTINTRTVADSSLQQKEVSFINPLLQSGPDPWVIQKDSMYYYLHTLGNRIGIYKTKAISDLKNATATTVWVSTGTGANSKNIWAPELHWLNDKWYIYYTAGATPDLSTQRSFVLENSSRDPLEGKWVDKGKIFDPGTDFFAIDGTIFNHKGKDYFIWSGHINSTDKTQRLYIAPMLNPWTLASSRKEISAPQYDWEKIGTPHVNEGPEILKNPDGKVFLIYSASGCWTDDYALGMLTLKEGGDPLNAADWIKSPEPVFTKSPENGAYGPGHNSFFKSADGKEDWIIYHANSGPNEGCKNARSPRAQKFSWKADGTPDFGVPVKIHTEIRKPSGE